MTTCLISLLPNVDHTVEINTECSELSLWFFVSCLVLNISKCNYVNFSLKHQISTYILVYILMIILLKMLITQNFLAV